METIEFENIITKKDIEQGKLILLSSRPGVGKTNTCIRLLKKFENYESLYFDLDGNCDNNLCQDINIICEYKSSLEIISIIENFVKKNNAKFVFIDSWKLVEDKNDWFLSKLLAFCVEKKLVVVITANLDRKVELRRKHLPKLKDFEKLGNLFKFVNKSIFIYRPNLYNEDASNDILFFEQNN